MKSTKPLLDYLVLPLTFGLAALISAAFAGALGGTHRGEIAGEIDKGWQTVLPAKITSETATNIIAGDNSSGCRLCYDNNGHKINPTFIPAIMGPPCQPYHAPTERWWITNVVKTTTIVVGWNKKEFTITDEELLSGVTNRQVLTQEWKVSGIRATPARPQDASTNFSLTTPIRLWEGSTVITISNLISSNGWFK